ncbi:MAG: SAM-dependent chlorinase/fluorinase [Halobacteriales archaeon]|nr:SAM-dependent chlorinase/fluorinase [Halobacteriales archaeon]
MREEVSGTFHARDVFGPAAAHLDKGAKAAEAGPEVRDAKFLDFGQGRVEDGMLVGEVVLLDRFGNAVTNIPGAVARTLLREGALATVDWAGGAVEAPFRRAYGEVAMGAPLLLVGSAGYLELAVREGSFAERSGLEPGMQVRIGLGP